MLILTFSQQHRTLEKLQKEATTSYNANKFGEALAKYKEIVKLDVHSKALNQCYNNMSNCAYKLELWEEVTEYTTKILGFGQSARAFLRRG
jgi:hypothetical protein